MQLLEPMSAERLAPGAVPVVVLLHNELNILPEFLAHYRQICDPAFLIVDDHSTDGSTEYLTDQPDVTVFRPRSGSTFGAHKAEWRGELLDHYGTGKWCLVPDLDEHFLWAGMEHQTLADYIAAVEAEGARAVATLMLDMYADAPLSAHMHPAESDILLRERFPLFDGPAPFPDGYFRRPPSARRRAFPTPQISFSGGVRNRLFHFHPEQITALQLWAARFLGLDGPVTPGLADLPGLWIARRLLRGMLKGSLNTTKLGLIRWQKGLRFNGGAHKLSGVVPLSESIAVFLHYPFTRGRAGVEYIAARGQHAEGARAYKSLLEGEGLDHSPVCATTRRYDGVASLAGLIRDVPPGR
ncbi:glycosyltransferase family 2 protein [Puniceibacterium sp. IMCC21224]|uniref:glycosyltransferase family 2 protein n=1 Tax=Puniceibacterium sp. IMCC21224 TaxID=1618204 RepID=UPI00065D106E|nr:glycosyltransferase family 2 protein [Puniceibacterium sp. IMCC21224]KMK66347.1 Glycosyl transferase family 2 [Puniceibacterium sp. IMCC21224]